MTHANKFAAWERKATMVSGMARAGRPRRNNEFPDTPDWRRSAYVLAFFRGAKGDYGAGSLCNPAVASAFPGASSSTRSN